VQNLLLEFRHEMFLNGQSQRLIASESEGRLSLEV